MRDFRKLEIWRLGMEVVKDVYTLIKKLPDAELYGISHQMRKAAISMPSNIAEGCSRSSNKEIARFFEISIGSSFELETQLIACTQIGYFSEAECEPVISKLGTFQRKTNSYKQTLL